MKKEESRYNIELVEQFLKDNCMSKASFCRKSGVCFETFSNFLTNRAPISFSSVIKIAKFTQISFQNLIKKSPPSDKKAD